MRLLLIAEDNNFAPFTDEVKKQDTKRKITYGVFDSNADIILETNLTLENVRKHLDEDVCAFKIDKEGFVYAFDKEYSVWGNNPEPESGIKDLITMLIWTSSSTSNYDFLVHQMIAIKSMTDDKMIHRHIDSTLRDIE